MWLKQEGQVERCNNVVKAGRLGSEMQQCSLSRKARFRDATMWLNQECQVERSNNVVKQEGKLRDATMWLKQEGQVVRCNNMVKAGRLVWEMQQCGQSRKVGL